MTSREIAKVILDRAGGYEIYADVHHQTHEELEDVWLRLDGLDIGDDALSVRARKDKLLKRRAVSRGNVNNSLKK